MPSAERLEEAWEWIRFAKEDQDTARVLLDVTPPKVRQCLFHAPQSAEKSLKAFLVANSRPYPLSHNLNVLLDTCVEVDASMRDACSGGLWLTQFAVRFRYPGEEIDFEIEDAIKGVADSAQVLAEVQTRLASMSPLEP